MLNINELDNDPWPTFPAKKEDLRKIASALEACMRRVEELEGAVCDWCDAIVDWEGVDFVERIEDEKSRKIIEEILGK